MFSSTFLVLFQIIGTDPGIEALDLSVKFLQFGIYQIVVGSQTTIDHSIENTGNARLSVQSLLSITGLGLLKCADFRCNLRFFSLVIGNNTIVIRTSVGFLDVVIDLLRNDFLSLFKMSHAAARVVVQRTIPVISLGRPHGFPS